MKDVLPGDKITINLNSLIESLPMIAPALDGWKANFDFYFEPWTNLYGFMDNNVREGTEDIINKRRHTFRFGMDVNAGVQSSLYSLRNNGVKPGSFLDFFGLPVSYFGDVTYDGDIQPGEFPAEKFLAYWDVIRNYYVNNQQKEFPVCVERNTYVDTADGGVKYYDLKMLDDLFMLMRVRKDGFVINDPGNWTEEGYLQNYDTVGVYEFIRNTLTYNFDNLHGLGLRTYRMDMNRGIMNADVGSLKSRVQVTDNQFSIDTLRFANKMQKLIDRFDVSGGRFSDWMRTQWSVKVRGNLDIPDYLGTVSEFFGNTDVIATANGAVSTSTGVKQEPKLSILGQQAGFAVGRVNRKNKPISFKSDQYGTLVCIFSLVPIVNYSQGIEIENLKTTFADVYSPAMSQLGFQDVDRRELSAIPFMSFDSDQASPVEGHPTVDAPSVGKRVAWSEYMASLGRNHGYFAYGEEMDYWVNQRQYTSELDATYVETNIEQDEQAYFRRFGSFDETTYVLPGHWNYLFASTARESMNFRLRCRFDITAKRPIGSRLMPHL